MARPSAIPTPPGLPKRGEVLDGRYVIEEPIGAGGMGVVVTARALALGQRVAIKFLLHESGGDPDGSERLLREARALGAIRSEHVARVLDVGRLPSGAPYMVMEHLAGTDLGRLRRARGRLPVADAVDAVLQAGEAVAEAHALGIVHRDLKPANLYVIARLDRTLCVKVLDFGLSTGEPGRRRRQAPHRDGERGRLAAVHGARADAEPQERRPPRRHLVDRRRPLLPDRGPAPLRGQDHRSACGPSILTGPPPPIASLRPDVPPALSALIQRCLERDLDRRVQDLAELARGLSPFASTRGQQSVDYIVRALGG